MEEIWIDGYNLFFALERGLFRGISVEIDDDFSPFDRLFFQIDTLFASSKTKVLIILDAKRRAPLLPLYGEERHFNSLTIISTPSGLCADRYIVEKLIAHPKAKTVQLVTADKGLSSEAQSRGAKILSLEGFRDLLLKRAKRELKEISDKPELPPPHILERDRKLFE